MHSNTILIRLATICSLDVRLCLQYAKKEVLVSTFGSPRVGNFFWRIVYEHTIDIHWRFAMQADIVTMMPRFGYHHVGKQVLLASGGNIFLDPNGLETFWSGDIASTAWHRKFAYILRIKTYCRKYAKDFEPNFWDYDIPEHILSIWEERCNVNLRQVDDPGDLIDDSI